MKKMMTMIKKKLGVAVDSGNQLSGGGKRLRSRYSGVPLLLVTRHWSLLWAARLPWFPRQLTLTCRAPCDSNPWRTLLFDAWRAESCGKKYTALTNSHHSTRCEKKPIYFQGKATWGYLRFSRELIPCVKFNYYEYLSINMEAVLLCLVIFVAKDNNVFISWRDWGLLAQVSLCCYCIVVSFQNNVFVFNAVQGLYLVCGATFNLQLAKLIIDCWSNILANL